MLLVILNFMHRCRFYLRPVETISRSPFLTQYTPRYIHTVNGKKRTSTISRFHTPAPWPPNHPDLNPVDYKIWHVMQEKIYKTKVWDFGELHQCIIQAWDEFDQLVIDAAISQWRVRLGASAEAILNTHYN